MVPQNVSSFLKHGNSRLNTLLLSLEINSIKHIPFSDWLLINLHVYSLGMGRYIEHRIQSISLKYHDKILQLLLCLKQRIIDGKVKIVDTNPKYEEIISFYPTFLSICRILLYSAFVVNMWRHFITSILLANTYNGRKTSNLGNKPEIWGNYTLLSYDFEHMETLIAILSRGNVHVFGLISLTCPV